MELTIVVLVLICLLIVPYAHAAQCSTFSPSLSHYYQFRDALSYYNQPTTEDIWIYVTSQFLYFSQNNNALVLFTELTDRDDTSPICAGLELTYVSPLPIKVQGYYTDFSNNCQVRSISSNNLNVNEWSHIISIHKNFSREYYINRAHTAVEECTYCIGAKYMFTMKMDYPQDGFYVRNYKLWNEVVPIETVMEYDTLRSALYKPYYPLHSYKLNEISLEIMDYGREALNLKTNEIFRLNGIDNFIKIHKIFPFDEQIGNTNEVTKRVYAAYMGSDRLSLPNVLMMLSNVTKEVSISFMIKLQQNKSEILNVMSISNDTPSKTFLISVNDSSLSALKEAMKVEINRAIEWIYICVSIYFNEALSSWNINLWAETNEITHQVVQSKFETNQTIFTLFPQNSQLVIPQFNGFIREFKIWSRVITTEELISYKEITTDCLYFPFLVAYWPFDDKYGNYTDQCRVFTLNASQFGVISRSTLSSAATPIIFTDDWKNTSGAYYHLTKSSLNITLDNKVPLTISLWIYATSNPPSTVILIKNGWTLEAVNGNIETHTVYQIGGVAKTWDHSLILPFKTWIFIAIEYYLSAIPGKYMLAHGYVFN